VTPVEVSQAAAELTHRWGSVDEFIDFVVEPKREKHANGDEETYFSADSSAFLAPVEIAALQRFKEGNDVVRLSTALQLYWKAHKKSGDAAFVVKVNRDWDKNLGTTWFVIPRLRPFRNVPGQMNRRTAQCAAYVRRPLPPTPS
jgi:hypothetical protein